MQAGEQPGHLLEFTWAAMTAGPSSPGVGPRSNQPAVTASAGTSISPVGVSARSIRPLTRTPIDGTSSAPAPRWQDGVEATGADGAAGGAADGDGRGHVAGDAGAASRGDRHDERH